MPFSRLPDAIPLLPEHKIGIFVLFWPSEPSFSGFSSTESAFLCAFWVWNPHFREFRAQNCGFCALLPFETLVFGLFEHKIVVFVLVCGKRGNWKTQFCHKKHLEGAVSAYEAIGKAQLGLSATSGCNWQHGGQSKVPRGGQCYFYWKKNREKKIYHTVLVELNGFIHSELVGTPLEGESYLFMGPRAYDSPNFLR